jgi:hypothetical protein
MEKNFTKNQAILIAIATLLLLLAAFSFYLLQDLSAPLPSTPPTPSSTATPLPPSPSYTPEPSSTSLPTHKTSYTPFASPPVSETGTPPESTSTSETASPVPSGTINPALPTNTSTIQPNLTITVSPTASQTLSAGEYEIRGRVVQNNTPVANVVVEFSDDAPARKGTTSPGGHYSFITLAPGSSFYLMFKQAENPQLTPASEIASFAWLEGTLPNGTDLISLPDLEVSLNVGGMTFAQQTPANGDTFSAAVINGANPIQFSWTVYNQGDSYYIELGVNGSEDPILTSPDNVSTNWMWNGTLDDGSHISAGNYWWRVAVNKSLGDYIFIAFTQKSDLIFNP